MWQRRENGRGFLICNQINVNTNAIMESLRRVFPENGVSGITDKSFKIHVEEVNSEQIRVLSDVSQKAEILLKRSGTGITIIVNEK